MAENSKMVFNSIAVTRRNSFKMIDLFAGCGGLSIDLEKRWKSNTIRVQKDSYESLWADNPCLTGLTEVFLANWETELEGVQKGTQYSVKADLDELCRIGRYEMTQNL